MPRLLFKLALLILIALMTISFAAEILGRLRSLHPVMIGLDTDCTGKPQPCWYGVVLGETTTKDVTAMFEQSGDNIFDNTAKGQLEIFKTNLGGCFAQFVYGRSGSTIINEIILTNCARVRLGDLLEHYGEPETLGTSISCDATHSMIQLDNYFIEYPANDHRSDKSSGSAWFVAVTTRECAATVSGEATPNRWTQDVGRSNIV